ncbi:MAG: terpene cyclase/mutase family protein [Acidobacteria bacterium]|nr:terpene cyclase/mutase family protein [Acidobacteriota bacterium]
MSRLNIGLAAVVLLALPKSGSADPPPAGEVTMDEATKKATAKALEFLATQQNVDGSWSSDRYPHNTAVTSFALLAFLSQGHLPGQGLYGPEVAKGARFLVAASRPSDGYLIGSRGGNMYCHGMATLALSELWGMTGDDEIRPVLEKAVDLIVRCQNREGGWRYEPKPTGADISATIMQVMALRAAKNSGLHVPEITLKRAIDYINSCRNPNTGGYQYQPSQPETGFARTAAGICVLQLTGNYEAQEIQMAAEYLERIGEDRNHFWYGQYYAVHAMHQVGGTRWEQWYAKKKKILLTSQSPSGSWTNKGSDDGVGVVYSTAISTIILSVPLNYLPIFQN